MNKINNKKGFTLFEVLVVCLIIAIISAIAVPTYQFSVEKSRAAKGVIMLDRIAKAQHTHRAKYGAYSESLSGLPLEITDTEGNILKTAEFNDEFFDYKIFGSEFDRARASRNNGEYELSVDYGTSEIMCRPIEHRICQDFGYREGDDFITWPQKTDCEPSQYGYSNSQYYCIRTMYKDGTKQDRICQYSVSNCYTYNNEGKKISQVSNNKGTLSVTTWDPNTGVRTSSYSRNEDGNGNIYSYSTYNPNTGKLETNLTTYYDFDHKPKGHEYYFYDDDSGKPTSYIHFGIDEIPLESRVWDYSTGSAKTVGNTTYYPSGKVKSYTTLNLSGQVMERVYYDELGNVTSHMCNSGPCKEDGYVVPPQGDIRANVPETYCAQQEDDDLFCGS